MESENKTIFTDFSGRQWRINLRLSFWLWFWSRSSSVNLAGVIYAAMREDFKAAGVSPQQSVHIVCCPQAMSAFRAAVMEWSDS